MIRVVERPASWVRPTSRIDNYGKTLVVYDKGTDESVAKSIAKLLGCGTPTVNDGSYTYEGSYLVIVGKDYKG